MARDPATQPNLENYEPAQPSPAGGFPGGTTSYPPAPNPYLRSPLPPSQQTDVDQLRQFYRVGTPQNRTLPLQPNANPANNAAAQTVAQQVSDSSAQSITLDIPKEFTPQAQSVDLPGPLAFNWATQPSGEVLATGENPGGDVYDIATQAGGTAADPMSLTITASQPAEWAFSFTENPDPALGFPWVKIPNTTGLVWNYGQYFPGVGTALAARASLGADWSSTLAFFGTTGASPANVGSVEFAGAIANTTALSSMTNVFNNTLLVCVGQKNALLGFSNFAVSDTKGNTYTLVAAVNDGIIPGGTSAWLFAALGINGGSNVITVSSTIGSGGGTLSVVAGEYVNIAAALSLPTFKKLTSVFIPPINLADVNVNGGVTGLLAHTNIQSTAVTPGSYTNADITVQADGTITAAANGSTSGVASVDGLTGALTLSSSDSSVTITPSGTNIDFVATGGGGGGASFGRKVVSTTTYNQITSDIGKALDVQTAAPTTINLAGAGISTVTYVQSANTGGGSSTFTLAFSGGNASGNTIFVMARLTSGSGTPTVADSNANAYVMRQNIANSGTQNIWWDSIGCAAGANTVTITASFSFCEMVIAEYSGISSFDTEAGTTGTGTTGNSGNITTTNPSEGILGWCSNETANGLTITAGAGFTKRDSANGNVAVEDQILSSAGSIAASFTFSSSVNWFTGVLAYNPTVSGTLFSGWVQNNGSSTVAITPTTGLINGASSVTLTAGTGATICTDNTNFTAVL